MTLNELSGLGWWTIGWGTPRSLDEVGIESAYTAQMRPYWARIREQERLRRLREDRQRAHELWQAREAAYRLRVARRGGRPAIHVDQPALSFWDRLLDMTSPDRVGERASALERERTRREVAAARAARHAAQQAEVARALERSEEMLWWARRRAQRAREAEAARRRRAITLAAQAAARRPADTTRPVQSVMPDLARPAPRPIQSVIPELGPMTWSSAPAGVTRGAVTSTATPPTTAVSMMFMPQ
jgi:hypothetical protein